MNASPPNGSSGTANPRTGEITDAISSAITIELNGTATTTSCTTLSDLLRDQGVDPERRGIAVAVNDAVVRRSEWAVHAIVQGDRVEIITALQGG